MGDSDREQRRWKQESETVSWTATGSGKHIKRTITYMLKDKKVSMNEGKIVKY